MSTKKRKALSDSESSSGSSGSSSGSDSDSSSSSGAARKKTVKKKDDDDGNSGGEKALEDMTEFEREQYLFEKDARERREREMASLQRQKESEATNVKRKMTRGNKAADSEDEEEEEEEAFDDDDDDEEDYVDGSEKKKKKKKPEAKKPQTQKQRLQEAFGSDSDSGVSSLEDDEDDFGRGLGGRSRPMAGRRFGRKVGGRNKSMYSSDEEDDEDGTKRNKIDLSGLIAMQLTRTVLVKWVDEPYFNECVGGFVRLTIGSNPNDPTKRTYRVCEIVEVEPSAEYDLEGKRVDVALVLKFGKSEKSWKLGSISNGPFQQDEFDFWARHVEEAGKRAYFPINRDVDKFAARIKKNVEEFTYTEQDIKKKIEKRKKRRKGVVNIAMEKTELERHLAYEKAQGNHERVEEIKERLLEIRAIQEDKQRVMSEKYNANQKVNARNAKQNLQGAGQIKVKSKNGVEVWNPFARKPTRPLNLWSTKVAGQPDTGEAEENNEKQGTSTESSMPEQQEATVSPRTKKSNEETDALGLSPFKNTKPKIKEVRTIHGQISIDMDLTNPIVNSEKKKKKKNPLRRKKKKTKASTKMSVDEYLKKLDNADE
uniref:Plus3 domain-containing protein n=1 Tax=Mucochytrium quahogii TaxID=96639 RepID=A0A7S2RXE9_9STRA|mmetsp:Transcript_23984/g.38352  ORF Transcript_23984/g.38352 Transcript_23984/m.38352 type:complete len:597 (+) Transcript_23984:276-2066(+)|eukprot:CAMPEP_0203745016 /NCGR_PEP_ID=MMETSP0098-20131031/898_1 /ASSEMBLY_ACC=CAM_ASM_000208 /TAXON_ID=96639 /ORGANISM=" , Strain NY0313808BC1" /LENGTH=596 /DNA_ID=CAMNT_0050632695 /DNA_START=253 /DNA_END=2043 /DNA_ORIENTATION=-